VDSEEGWREDCEDGWEGFYIGEATERDESSCALEASAICEGWGSFVEWQRERDGGRKGGVIDEVNENVANIVVDRDCDIKRKTGNSCRCSAGRATTQVCKW